MVYAAPPEHWRLAVSFGVPIDLEDVELSGLADADGGEPEALEPWRPAASASKTSR